MKFINALLCIIACCLVSGTSAVFHLQQECKVNNYKVYNVYMNGLEQFKMFNNLREKFSLHLMREANPGGQLPFNLALEPKYQKPFEQALKLFKIKYELVHENLQELIDERNKGDENFKGSKIEMSWTQYHNLSTIERWISQVARDYKFVQKRSIGRSFWKRPIYVLEVAKNPAAKKTIKIFANIHAIEWLSSAVATCFLDRLLKSDGDGSELDYLLNNYQFIVLPVQNPDGFHFTHTKCPLWRKTRSFNGDFNSTGLCYGVDPNRNYDVYFKEAGYNRDVPCDHFYAGKRANSEPEVYHAVRYQKTKKNVKYSFHLHTFGQLVLRPYGHSVTLMPKNVEQIDTISNAFVEAAKATHGQTYLTGSSGDLLGFVSGSSKDYDYEHDKVPYSVTVELRDRGRYAFFLPPDQILDTCDEFTAGLIAAVRAGEKTGL